MMKRTWIGYILNDRSLPVVRQAIVGCNGIPLTQVQQFSTESLQLVDQWYARDYEPILDLKLIWKSYRQLGG
jgi:hypothetical protein